MSKDPRTIADFTATLPNGETTSLADRLGRVVLVVNTASKCGFTPQYKGLEELWRKYREQGFEIIAFPCNQFGGQEPGDAAEIAAFCEVNFGLSFPLMGKVEVNGPDTVPLYDWLKAEAPGLLGSKSIKWNFTKFLIDREGKVVRRFAPTDKPAALDKEISKLLSSSGLDPGPVAVFSLERAPNALSKGGLFTASGPGSGPGRRRQETFLKAPTFLSAIILAATACSPVAIADPVAVTRSGEVRGEANKGVVSWKGIPFAAPPVGDLRWRAPQPVAAWAGVRPATAYGHDCMQKPFPSDAAPLGTPPAEDCLYLNVWKPEGAKAKLPVVFWIYGGGFLNGGASPPTYSGAELARKGVMVVSFNYRVGRFGTFAHPQLTKADADGGLLGNYGTLDQVAALKWVHQNIAAFGGDPANVTIIGESAGGMSVHMLMTSPLTQGLFARAVVMSGGDGTALGAGGLAEAEKTGTAFAATKGIAADDPQALAKLRALPAEQVVDGLNLEALFAAKRPAFSSPFVYGRIAVDVAKAYTEGKFTKVPVMIGATSADMGGPDGFMIKGARDVARTLSQAGAPVYAYRFSYVASSVGKPGAGHASDIPFFFDTQTIKYGDVTTARDDAMGGTISDALVAFATSGDPSGGKRPVWPRYDPASDIIMDFAADGEARVGHDPLTAR